MGQGLKNLWLVPLGGAQIVLAGQFGVLGEGPNF